MRVPWKWKSCFTVFICHIKAGHLKDTGFYEMKSSCPKMFHQQEIKSRGICYLDSSIMSYCKISSFDAILPSTIFCTMIALSSSEMCCREIRGIMGIPETSPCCNHGSNIISCRLARCSGSRTRSLAINLQSYGTT